MKVLGLDFETTGLEPGAERVIEVGAVVWDVQRGRPLCMMSELVIPSEDTVISPEVSKLTGIENKDLQEFGVDPGPVLTRLNEWMGECDYVVAHNAPFDKAFYLSEIEHLGLHPTEKPWIDTLVDLPYPSHITARKLNHVAADHQILNPHSHRALFDVMTTLKLFSQYDFKKVEMRQASPTLEVISHVSYDDREKAKGLGFRWKPETKQWIKVMKKCDLDEAQFPFEVTANEV